jgi:hypothetical protein
VRTPGELAASGPRAAAHADALRDAVDAVQDGYEHHYGAPQESDPAHPADRDLALLHGDRRYADGLAALAALGDLPAIAELADVISLCAQAHAAGDEDLAAAVWIAGATANGWGETPDLVGAKSRARAAEGGAADALRDAADRVRRPSPHG